MVRERLLTISGKVSASLAGCDRAVIVSKLLDEITEALAELHEPAKSDGGQREGAPAPRSRQKGRSGPTPRLNLIGRAFCSSRKRWLPL